MMTYTPIRTPKGTVVVLTSGALAGRQGVLLDDVYTGMQWVNVRISDFLKARVQAYTLEAPDENCRLAE
jgi:hypothetical protein